MAGVCEICGRHPGFGMKVSHSHRRSKRRWVPNVQKLRVQVDGGGAKRLNVCTKCLKAGKVRRAV